MRPTEAPAFLSRVDYPPAIAAAMVGLGPESLGIGRTTLNRWVRAGKLPGPVKSVSGMLLFERQDVDRLARARTSDPLT